MSGLIASLQNLRGRGGFLVCILLGAFAVLGHAPLFIWPAFVAALSLFWVHLDAVITRAQRPGRAAFWAGWAMGFGCFLAGLYWVASAFLTRGGGYVWLTPIGVLLMPAGLAFFWALAGLAYSKLAPQVTSPAIRAMSFALILFLAEWLRGHILSGFPWNLPGYIWEAGGALSQNASYMGIYGLSFVTLLFALSFGPALIAGPSKLIGFLPAAFMSFIMLCGASFGNHRLSGAKVKYVAGTNIRVIQAKINQIDKHSAGGYSRTIDTYLDLSLNPSNANLSHVIWSEGAIPGLVLEDAGLMQAIDRIFAGGPDLYMGATRRVADPDAQDGYRYYNSMAAMRSTGTGNPQVLGYYNKSKLVPFGEYFPGNSLISGLNIPSLSAATASFDKGIAETSTFPGLPPVSVQICYESIFSGFTPAEPKPEWILNISNDSWFGDSSGPHQHFNQVRYRAIEEGLPIVRAAASGYSGFVDPWGRVIKTLPLTNSGAIDSPLPASIH